MIHTQHRLFLTTTVRWVTQGHIGLAFIWLIAIKMNLIKLTWYLFCSSCLYTICFSLEEVGPQQSLLMHLLYMLAGQRKKCVLPASIKSCGIDCRALMCHWTLYLLWSSGISRKPIYSVLFIQLVVMASNFKWFNPVCWKIRKHLQVSVVTAASVHSAVCMNDSHLAQCALCVSAALQSSVS